MEPTSPFDTAASQTDPALLGARVTKIDISEVSVPQISLRFGGLTMDPRTGVTHWRGRALALAASERELLGILLRHAGQILTTERIAVLLSVDIAQVDAQINTLVIRLKQAGVTCLPCRASGLGYVLWRS